MHSSPPSVGQQKVKLAAAVAGKMAANLSDVAEEAANLALRIGSDAVDAISFMAEIGEELPFIKPVFGTLKAIRGAVETVKNNRKELESLERRCTYLTACVIVKTKHSAGPQMDVAPLEGFLKEVESVVDRFSTRRRTTRGKVKGVWKASGDKEEITRLKEGMRDLEADLNAAGIATLAEKTGTLEERLVSSRMPPPFPSYSFTDLHPAWSSGRGSIGLAQGWKRTHRIDAPNRDLSLDRLR